MEGTSAEGPGRRVAVWVRGCSIRCPGCFNPHLWSEPHGRGELVNTVVRQVLAADGIEGVTLLGGEPFDQAGALADLGQKVRAAGLSVMTFTGHVLEDLRAGSDPDVSDLLAATDLLVDGPFDQTRPDHRRPWVGSTNQRFHFLTDRYRELAEALDGRPDRLEVRLAANGSVFINGMASTHALRDIRAAARLTHAGSHDG